MASPNDFRDQGFDAIVDVIVFSHQFPTQSMPFSGRFVEDQITAGIELGISFFVVQVVPTPLSRKNLRSFLRAVWSGLVRGDSQKMPHGRGVQLTSPGPRLGGPVQALITAFVIWRWTKRSNFRFKDFALIHAHTGLLDGFSAYIASLFTGLPFLITEHTAPYSSLFRRFGGKFLTGIAAKKAERVVAVSSSLREEIVGHFSSVRPVVIGNTFRPEVFNPASLGESSWAGRELPIRITWIGHINERKRLDLAVKVASALVEAGSDVILEILSTSAIPTEIENLISRHKLVDRVRHHRIDDRREMARKLRRSSVQLVTSTFETFSVATLEALACGAPVVSTPCGGPRDLILRVDDGCVTESESVSEIANAIVRIVEQDTFIKREGRAARALANFGPKKVGRDYMRIYREIALQSNRSNPIENL